MNAPASSPVRTAPRRLLLALVPLVVLVVVAALLLGGGRDDRGTTADAESVATSPHAGHSPEVPASASAPSTDADADADADAPAANDGAAPAPAPGSTPVPSPQSPADGHAMGAPTGTSLAQAAGAPTSSVREGANALGEPRAPVDPADVLDSTTALGGCHPAYGEAGQCLPLVPPSMAAHAADMVRAGLELSSMPHPWTCTELLTLFPDGIAVRDGSGDAGVDPFGLDVDGDGLACAVA